MKEYLIGRERQPDPIAQTFDQVKKLFAEHELDAFPPHTELCTIVDNHDVSYDAPTPPLDPILNGKVPQTSVTVSISPYDFIKDEKVSESITPAYTVSWGLPEVTQTCVVSEKEAVWLEPHLPPVEPAVLRKMQKVLEIIDFTVPTEE